MYFLNLSGHYPTPELWESPSLEESCRNNLNHQVSLIVELKARLKPGGEKAGTYSNQTPTLAEHKRGALADSASGAGHLDEDVVTMSNPEEQSWVDPK